MKRSVVNYRICGHCFGSQMNHLEPADQPAQDDLMGCYGYRHYTAANSCRILPGPVKR